MSLRIDGTVIKAVGANNKVHLVVGNSPKTLCGRVWQKTMQHYPKITQLDETPDDLCCGVCRRLAPNKSPNHATIVD